MHSFTVFPAIDLRHGRVVRLKHGDPDQQTVFDDDPLAVAERWVAAGAKWLHVVNLDGAFEEGGKANWHVLPRLTGLRASSVQFGGGLRTLDEMARALDQGVSRIILGTVAVEAPPLVAAAVKRFGPERVVIGIDAHHGAVRTRGWQTEGEIDAVTLGNQMHSLGVKTAIHTDIVRDGILAGVNARASAALAQKTGLHVIASGGVASLADVRRAAAYARPGVAGVVTGRALYEGQLDLAEALAVARSIGVQDK